MNRPLTNQEREMTENNLKLIEYVINKRWASVPELRDDLYQEGFLGLCHAVMNYKEGTFKFSTYAFSVINSYMLNYYNYALSDFKVTEGTYREAKLNRALRIDQVISFEEGSPLSIADTIPDKTNDILDFERYYNAKQNFDRVFGMITPEEHKFLIDFYTKSTDSLSLKEKRKRETTYKKLIHKVKYHALKDGAFLDLKTTAV